MAPRRSVSRRSFLQRITGGAAGAGALLAVGGRAKAFQVTDSDRYIADQPGLGRGPVSGITDQDPGDAVGNGRGDTRRAGTGVEPARPPSSPFEDNQKIRHAESGLTDSDPSDPPGDGRGGTPQGPPARSPYDDNQNVRHAESGITDSDPTDPVGDGRGPSGRPVHSDQAPSNTTCSDTDSGIGRDPAGRGRRC